MMSAVHRTDENNFPILSVVLTSPHCHSWLWVSCNLAAYS